MEESEILEDPNKLLYLGVLVGAWLHRKSFGEMAQGVLIETKRKYKVEGENNIPKKGPFLVVANHFVRVRVYEKMSGGQKENDMLATIGLINTVVKNNSSVRQILWTPSELPRPEGKAPAKPDADVLIRWLRNDAKYSLVNMSRFLFLKMFSYSEDILPVPATREGVLEFFRIAKEWLQEGGVMGIFPEGEVSRELKKAKAGFAHLAIVTGTPVLPMAIFDEGGVLNMKIGLVEIPPKALSGKREYADLVMNKVAKMLPEGMRGYYK